MPPKISTSKEMIIEAGYSIADEEGIGQVHCRAIAKIEEMVFFPMPFSPSKI